MNKKVSLIIRIFLSVLFLCMAFYFVGYHNFLTALKNTPLSVFVVYLVYMPLAITFGALNIYLLLSATSISVSFKTWWKYYAKSWALGLITPAKVGEFSLVYFLRKKQVKIGSSVALILIDKIITFFLMIIIALFSSQLFSNQFNITYLLFSAFSLFLVLALFITNKTLKNYVIKKLNYRIITSFITKIKGYSQTIIEVFQNKRFITANFGLTLFRYFIGVYVIHLAFFLIGNPVNYWHIFIIQSLVILISSVPITNAGLGLKEGTAVFLFSLVGVPTSITFIVYLSFTLVTYFVGFMIFLIFRKENEPAKKELL
jgi:glycosyltransferase 2 family protein